MLQAHSNEWYDRLSETQDRYYYPWHSHLAPNHGEDNYIALVKKEVKRTDTVIDIGCGSGELTNEIACFCKRIIGYDRVPRFIETAKKTKEENATFLLYDSKVGKRNGRLPVEDRCIDVFISSKGPLHWISDVRRIAKHNAHIIMLVPYVEQEYEWNQFLPPELQYQGYKKDGLIESIQMRLESVGLKLDQLDIFEADETFSEQQEFMKFITWGKFDIQIDEQKLKASIEEIFQIYGQEGTLVIKHDRFIWRSTIRIA